MLFLILLPYPAHPQGRFLPGFPTLRMVFPLVSGARPLEDVVKAAGGERVHIIAAELVEKGFCVREGEQSRWKCPGHGIAGRGAAISD